MKGYDHKKIERKWQKEWATEKLYKTPDKKKGSKNLYTLVEFAYPSGNLHVGHWYAFSVPDIYARYMRMRGYNVLSPFGFDAFGLPAENAAIKRGLNPRDWTYENIDHMRRQLKTMGNMFDWSREVITSDPSYYRWTQWLFLQLFKNDLVYRAPASVNWCPSCKTVLANEQVVNGECERCESDVIQRTMKQWMLKITNYAERLLKDLDDLDWPESIKDSQRRWIGKNEGVELTFKVKNTDSDISVFTTRPDTLFGATYIVLAPEHEIVHKLKSQVKNWSEVEAYIQKSNKKTERERQEHKDKAGVELKGIFAINPGNKKEIPVWVGDYILSEYGTGAIMAVPAHDERDWDFAHKFSLPFREVITGGNVLESAYIGTGTLTHSGRFDGMTGDEAASEIIKFVGGKTKTTYRLRDWVVSRQRYWGCPIPIVHCGSCGVVPVPEDTLPVLLPDIDDYMPRDDGRSPLAKAHEWSETTCPKCGKGAERETDTLDTFVDSSWYYLRYIDPHNETVFADDKKMKAWLPVDMYSGGPEHTTMHLLYSRFLHKALYDIELVSEKEPYAIRMNRSLILGPDGNKMSKSRDNIINPDDVVRRLGADTVRMYLAFIGPYNEVGAHPWNADGILGVRRFLEKVWRVGGSLKEPKQSKGVENLEMLLQQTIKKVGDDITRFKFNTAVSQMMIFITSADREGNITKTQFETFLKLLAPFAPHIAEELWHALGHDSSIHIESWPSYDDDMILDKMVTVVVQVNGKVKGTFVALRGMSEKEAQKQALSIPAVARVVEEGNVERVIHVPNRLVNIVLLQRA